MSELKETRLERLERLFGKQSDEEKKESENFIKSVIAIRKAITDKHGKEIPKEFIVEEMECPLCSQRRVYTISQSNGHIHSACSNKECVIFIE